MMNTWTMENLNATDKDERLYAMIERIKQNAERKGILDYAERELALCEVYSDYKKLSEEIWDYFPPSERQIETANKLADELGLAHPVVNENHGQQWFSKYIGMAIEATGRLPITEAQADKIQAMQWCPDCPKITAEEKANRKNASEYIAKYNADFMVWKRTRLEDSTRRTLKSLYKKVEGKEVTDNYLLQYDETTAQKMIKHLRELQKELNTRSVEAELMDEFRQFFVDDDNNDRNERRKTRK